jgi:hypothetical protein
MAELSIKILKIRNIKQNLDLDFLENLNDDSIKFSVERVFTVKLDIEAETVSIGAGNTIGIVKEEDKRIEVSDITVETMFKVLDLKSHLNEQDDLNYDQLRVLVNLAYHHTRALQAILTHGTVLETQLIPLMIINSEDDLSRVSTDSEDI